MDDITVCAAALVRCEGKTVFAESDIVMGMSLKHKWMAPSDAKIVLKAMLASGIMEKKGDVIKFTADISSVDVPIAYRPPAGFVEYCSKYRGETRKESVKSVVTETQDIMPTMMSMATSLGMERKDFMSRCNALTKNLGIHIEAAGLIVLRDAGADIDEIADRVYLSVMEK